jgi:hypothetical protein
LKPLPFLVCLGLALPAFAQYAGPAVLARGEAPSSLTGPNIKFRPFVELTGTYDTGLANVSVNDTGQLANGSSYGAQLAWGISGNHDWKHTTLGLSYRGSFAHYVQKSAYDSINQDLLLGVTHQFTRHTMVSFRETAGIFSRDAGPLGLTQTVPFDPSTTYVPTTDFFDNRTMYSETQLDFVLQKSARLSFDLGGNAYLVGRRSQALNGVRGLGARGDVQYRVTRRTTIGAGYTFQHFTFSRIFGAADVHDVAGSYSVALNATTEFSALVGAARIELTSIRTVPIDPAIAALLGITTGLEVAHLVAYTPTFTARLSKTLPQGVVYLAGGRSITPGNGLFLTSYATSALAGYTYTGLRRWSLNVNAMYTRASAVGAQHSRYGTVIGSLAASRQIARSLHFIASLSARRYLSPDFHNYNRLVYVATMGIGFTPGDVPLRLW